jgi:hypothetical protein
MDKQKAIAALKKLVSEDIRYLCRRADLCWNAPIVETMRDLRTVGGKSVFFGGSIRSLLTSRLLNGTPGRPRDVDVVVDDITIDMLKEKFGHLVSRETRFGGLQLLRSHWHFDVWPLNRTWAFLNDNVENPSFEALPKTTFFNMEAIAVEVWPSPGVTRVVFSGDEQFFDGILTRTLEINKEENPFPTLCVVRALVMASSLDLFIGKKLARYLAFHADSIKLDELVSIQLKHYGKLRVSSADASSWLTLIRRLVDSDSQMQIRLPISRQGSLWPDHEPWPMLFRYL